jgi:hypothetical protein
LEEYGCGGEWKIVDVIWVLVGGDEDTYKCQ